jgi:predicted nucleic acid-binding protein
MNNREEYIKNNRKKYSEYSDKIVIADSQPLICLNNINKIGYLKMLFSEVYTTQTVRDECKFKFPDWIKVEEPQSMIKNALSRKGMDKGEKSAIALAMEIDVMNKHNIIKSRPCLILDDHRAEKIFNKWNLGIKSIKLRDVLTFAFDKKLFTREEGEKLIEEIGEKGRPLKKNDIMIIFNDTTTINKGRKI